MLQCFLIHLRCCFGCLMWSSILEWLRVCVTHKWCKLFRLHSFRSFDFFYSQFCFSFVLYVSLSHFIWISWHTPSLVYTNALELHWTAHAFHSAIAFIFHSILFSRVSFFPHSIFVIVSFFTIFSLRSFSSNWFLLFSSCSFSLAHSYIQTDLVVIVYFPRPVLLFHSIRGGSNHHISRCL